MGLLLTAVDPMRSCIVLADNFIYRPGRRDYRKRGPTLIWRAIVRKACSTLVAFFAEVSKNGIPRLSANS